MIAFIFDMDGLILDTQRLAHLALQQAALECGFKLNREDCEAVRGLNESETVRCLERRLAIAIDPTSYLRTFHRHYNTLLSNGVTPKAGLFELLELLEERKIPKAVATSTYRERAIVKLTNADVIERFPIIVGGDEVQFSKPAPDLFLLAAKRLGVTPGDCYVLEDADSGIVAATSAGMHPIMVPDGNTPSTESERMAEKIFNSLSEVREMVLGYVGGGKSGDGKFCLEWC